MHAVVLSPKDKLGGISHYSMRLGKAMNVGVFSYNLKNAKGKDLVHVQFEYNVKEFMPIGLTFVPYLLALRLLRKKIVVTLHNVYSVQHFGSSITTSYYTLPRFVMYLAKLYFRLLTRIICSLVHAVVVLNKKAKGILENEYGVEGGISYIEFCSYGLCEQNLLSEEEAKAKLGFSGRILLFSFGTLHPRKQYEIVISLLPRLRERYPNMAYMVSKVLPSSNPRKGLRYLEELLELAHRLNVEENIVFVGHIADAELKYYFRASDAVIFPHRDGAFGSSASKHAMSYLARMICSDVSCFEDFEDGVHCLKFNSREDLLQEIVRAIEHRPDFSDALRRKIEELSIESHAERHLDIYERVLRV